ncbi:MAG: hypothetical protein R6U52_03500 [Kosmotogaceae bacterium]
MEDINLHSKKRSIRMFDFILLLVVGLAMVFAGHFVISKIFAMNLENLSDNKSFLLSELNLELSGNPSRDLELIKGEKQLLVSERNSYINKINELSSYIKSKENDILFLLTAEAYLSDKEALQTTFNKLEYKGATGELLYYVVYEKNGIPNKLSPLEVSNGLKVKVSGNGEIEFSEYKLKLIHLQAGE